MDELLGKVFRSDNIASSDKEIEAVWCYINNHNGSFTRLAYWSEPGENERAPTKGFFEVAPLLDKVRPDLESTFVYEGSRLPAIFHRYGGWLLDAYSMRQKLQTVSEYLQQEEREKRAHIKRYFTSLKGEKSGQSQSMISSDPHDGQSMLVFDISAVGARLDYVARRELITEKVGIELVTVFPEEYPMLTIAAEGEMYKLYLLHPDMHVTIVDADHPLISNGWYDDCIVPANFHALAAELSCGYDSATFSKVCYHFVVNHLQSDWTKLHIYLPKDKPNLYAVENL